jgi:hypothetical protein
LEPDEPCALNRELALGWALVLGRGIQLLRSTEATALTYCSTGLWPQIPLRSGILSPQPGLFFKPKAHHGPKVRTAV